MRLHLPNRPDDRVLSVEELNKGHWALYMDVRCVDCGKEHALTNTNNGRCMRCGGECK